VALVSVPFEARSPHRRARFGPNRAVPHSRVLRLEIVPVHRHGTRVPVHHTCIAFPATGHHLRAVSLGHWHAALRTRVNPPFGLEALLQVSVVLADTMHFAFMLVTAAIVLGQGSGREDREGEEESLRELHFGR
jgi:hypothetical protein